PSGQGGHDDYDRRGGRGGGRRDRDRRGKKPKIPSFENKSYEPRPEERERSYSSSLEALPGESLSKLSRRSDSVREEEDRNAPLGAVAEEPPVPTESEPHTSSREDIESPRTTEAAGHSETEEKPSEAPARSSKPPADEDKSESDDTPPSSGA